VRRGLRSFGLIDALIIVPLVALAIMGKLACDADACPGENPLKNRVDPPTVVTDATVTQIVAEKTIRRGAVRVTGCLIGVREEGPEATNCFGRRHEDRDWHLLLTERCDSPRREAIVVEVTPRLRVSSLAELRQMTRVRVTGWLFLDPEHAAEVGRSRATRWEIHPVTSIERL
jgi:hypothetical protein